MLNAGADDLGGDALHKTSPMDVSLKQKYITHNIENRAIIVIIYKQGKITLYELVPLILVFYWV